MDEQVRSQAGYGIAAMLVIFAVVVIFAGFIRGELSWQTVMRIADVWFLGTVGFFFGLASACRENRK